MPAERGDAVELPGDRQLQVVARDALVVGHRLDLVAMPAGRVRGVDEERTGPAAVGGGRVVEGERADRGLPHHALGLREAPEPVAHGGARLGQRPLRGGHDRRPVFEEEAGVGAKPGEDLVEVVGVQHLAPQLPVLVGEAGDLSEADVVDLLCGQIGGRVAVEQHPIGVLATVQPAQAGLLLRPGDRCHGLGDDLPELGPSRSHLALHDLGEAGRPLGDLVLRHRRRRFDAEQRVVGQVGCEVGVELPDGEVARVPRRGSPGVDPLDQTLRRLPDPPPQLGELGHHGGGVCRLEEGKLLNEHRHVDLDADGVVDRDLGETEAEDVGVGAGLEAEQVAGDRLVGGQVARVDRVGPVGELAGIPRWRCPRPPGSRPPSPRRTDGHPAIRRRWAPAPARSPSTRHRAVPTPGLARILPGRLPGSLRALTRAVTTAHDGVGAPSVGGAGRQPGGSVTALEAVPPREGGVGEGPSLDLLTYRLAAVLAGEQRAGQELDLLGAGVPDGRPGWRRRRPRRPPPPRRPRGPYRGARSWSARSRRRPLRAGRAARPREGRCRRRG